MKLTKWLCEIAQEQCSPRTVLTVLSIEKSSKDDRYNWEVRIQSKTPAYKHPAVLVYDAFVESRGLILYRNGIALGSFEDKGSFRMPSRMEANRDKLRLHSKPLSKEELLVKYESLQKQALAVVLLIKNTQ